MLPNRILASDTLKFETTHIDDYTASIGWVLSYTITNALSKYTITCTSNGDDFTATVPATSTGLWAPGNYAYIGRVEKEGEIHTIEQGEVSIVSLINIADNRTHAKMMLDAIESVLEGRITADIQRYTIAGRSLDKIPFSELIPIRDKYKAEYIRQKNYQKVARGERLPQYVIRFT